MCVCVCVCVCVFSGLRAELREYSAIPAVVIFVSDAQVNKLLFANAARAPLSLQTYCRAGPRKGEGCAQVAEAFLAA